VTFVLPLAIQVVDSGDAADVEVLPAAVGRDGFEVVRAKVTLLWLLADVDDTVQVMSIVSYNETTLGAWTTNHQTEDSNNSH